MPIPSLASSLKPRGQISKAKDAPPTAESSRLPHAEHLVRKDLEASIIAHPLTRHPQSSSIPHPNAAEGVKRRSFLPQRGDMKPVLRKNGPSNASIPPRDPEQHSQDLVDSSRISASTTSSQIASMQGLKQVRSRPQSMYQTSSIHTTQETEESGLRPSRSTRPPDAGRKASVSQPTGLDRSQSLRKLGIPMQSAQSTNSRGHSRTLSTSTVIGSRKESSHPRTLVERPKSLFVAPSQRTIAANSVSVDDASHGTKSSARLAALKRTASTRSKPEATDSSDSAGPDCDVQFPTNNGRRREPIKEESKKQARPAFSTLQQHFTPRKTGKAPTSSFLHPPASDPSVCALPPEIICIQAELLQLHILHEASARTNRHWEVSARRKLHSKFDEVASLYQVMRDNERQGQEQTNIQALREWSSANSSFGLVEHIQLLSGPLHDLPTLIDPSGRFTRLVDEFTRWIAWVEDIWATRKGTAKEQGVGLGSTEGLGGSWRAENAALTRKVTGFLRDLDRLTQPAPGSSIASIVSTCKELLTGMLGELRTMQTIETGVVAKEKDWVEGRLKAIAQDIETHLVPTSEGNAAWRI
ncbi:uncharacterized protein BDR25DRAFT_309895 [Lindgomyces ingoldianus]|uniref:Uncharacterized protein n=1 Tax=Lindgomyces ingoldianus TaxID=673940 RepID=A0ACB6RDE8_9PLEO|nr:uncharacterized protein BDR25DRAFT_309895 [Lindgomyces ingoldianus]KAF2476511.1 hypothetical protein BDR25DRAFT_309895 [Lindgomyces ingoldianus]